MSAGNVKAALLCALALTLSSAPAEAGDPDLVWRTIDTDHFVIHYHTEIDRLARRLGVVAEDAHQKLSPLFGHVPPKKTHLVLADTSDDANGFATVLPFPNVFLFATAPEDRSELNDYDDWLSALILHEYTHILHIDTIHGLWRLINFVLGFGDNGRVFAPNQAQPRFIIEGLAVLEETERTGGGRLRSTIYDMFLRMAALEGKFQRLDQFTNRPLQFPRGASAYLYGSAFLRYIAGRFGADVWRKVSHEYGGHWFLGAVNRALKRVTGSTYESLYPDFKAAYEARYRKQAEAIDAVGRTRPMALTGPRDSALRPTFTRDGREVVWADDDGYSRAQLRRIVPDGKARPRTFFLVDGAGGSTFSPDGKTLYFDAYSPYRSNYFFKDLWSLDVASGKKIRLTHGLRAAEPDLSPDGRTLAFQINAAGSRSLVTMPAAGGAVKRLLGNLDDLSQVYTPAWSPDGRTIAFSWWRDGGYRDIWTVAIDKRGDPGALTRITADRALDLDPRFSPDGKYLYFSSDRTGVYNLYAFELATGATWQVTNVYGGAFDVAIAPDGKRAVYVGFVADGWRLEAIDLDPRAWLPAPSPLSDRPEVSVPKGGVTGPSRAYAPLETAWAHTWMPSLATDAFGQVIGLTFAGADLAGIHAWSLGIGFSLARLDAVSVQAAYAYNRLFTPLSLVLRRALTRRGGFVVDGLTRPYVEDDYTATAAISFPFLRELDQSSTLSLSYNLAWLKNADGVQLPLDPNLLTGRLPETGLVASLGLSWNFSNVRRWIFSISPELGRQLSASVGLGAKAIGSQYNVISVSWSWQEYFPLWWRRHVLTFRFSGGAAGGDITRRGVFFLGGYAPQSDPLRAVFDFTRAGGASLRGYPFGAIFGTQFHVMNLEYRFPIVNIERGYATLPVYARWLHGALFVDVGNAFNGPFDPRELKVGVGGELRLEVLFAHDIAAAFQLGYARGLMKGGGDQVYFYLNNPF